LASEKQEFLRVVEANQATIRSLCKAYYASLDDRRDVFQDIILQLWKSFKTFRGESKISTWIYRVSLNTILAKVRDEKRKLATEPMSGSELAFYGAKADDNTELLTMVLRCLRDVDKAIVILYLEGYKTKEISQILEITPTNVTTRLSRVKAELKSRFNSNHYEFKQP
jgi:RNA polymerase sigma-70 factor (ECF subfamily)